MILVDLDDLKSKILLMQFRKNGLMAFDLNFFLAGIGKKIVSLPQFSLDSCR